MCLFKQILEAIIAISVAFSVIHVITDINQAHRFTIFENIQNTRKHLRVIQNLTAWQCNEEIFKYKTHLEYGFLLTWKMDNYQKNDWQSNNQEQLIHNTQHVN